MIVLKCLDARAFTMGLLWLAGCAGEPNANVGRCTDGASCAASARPQSASPRDGSEPTLASQRAPGSDAEPLDPEQVMFGVRFQDVEGMALAVVALECGGGCTEVEAVVHGGNPPYALQWDDGSTQPVRRVCADDQADLSVHVTDTALHTAEFNYEAQMATATIETRAFECTDAGTCEPGPGRDTPEPGHYEGTGTYVCDNDMSAESAALVNHLTVSLDFEIDEAAAVQGGHAFFQWGLVVIAGDGRLEGALECGGALRASLHEGTWGVPGAEPMTVIPTGTVTGEFTARAAGEPGKIIGTWSWTSMSAVGAYGNMCNGTYEAELTPR